MSTRTRFPPVFWIANVIEVLERFAYYGIYFGFGIYMASLGYSRAQLGVVQTVFVLLSYMVPVVSGTMADRYGFKPVFVVSCLAYFPAIVLLMFNKTFAGIVVTMLCIGLAAGIFKPLVSGCIRVVTDSTNKTLGFGIFYAMVNVGGSFGPITAGRLRAISWNYAFGAAAAAIVLMLLVVVLLFEEPSRERSTATVGEKLREIGVALADLKFAAFLLLLGVFFWVPFWAFFNLCALYVDRHLDTARLYVDLRGVLGHRVASFLSAEREGVRHLLGETVSHTGWVIILLQVLTSGVVERFRALPAFTCGLAVMAAGFGVLGCARVGPPSLVFAGIFLFAVGEMIASPRIQEYITWIAPKEKAGLYMGSNFLAISIGAFSGVIYTSLHGRFEAAGHPEYVWYVIGAHTLLAVPVFLAFIRFAGEFKEQEA
jgi:proton-dependent oligopeptide transporter, POT family